MKIGYPCINLTMGCRGNRTFRLRSYSDQRLIETVGNNLDCLLEMLKFNVVNNLMFFRITSDLVPFASHPVCRLDWLSYFKEQFLAVGAFIKSNNIRISMHPGQYTVINSFDNGIVARSIRELQYHTDLLDALGLDQSAKVQIHVGGVYGNKEKSMRRFIDRYHNLGNAIKRRLVIENDDRSYSLDDCLKIHGETGLPVLFDTYHNEANKSGYSTADGLAAIANTWHDHDGIPMVDYSDYRAAGPKASHAESIDISNFVRFLRATKSHDCDIMLEIKDKEQSALRAVEVARHDKRFL
jgi:UV DNA damage endonuclease